MTSKIIVGPIDSGLQQNRTQFNIDNDSFPILINAYQWRGRVKRKRGTSLLCRLRRFFDSNNPSYGSITTFNLVAGAGNILTSFLLQVNGNIEPGSVTLTEGGNVYTDPAMDGTLVGNPAGTGTINYATGDITISGGAGGAVTLVSFNYFPDLPVMGIEDWVFDTNQFPGTIGFDTKYSYNIMQVVPNKAYDISFYKNPTSGDFPLYVQKANETPTTWNGKDYQQFWTVNYQGAFWATNGINVPFDATNIGMQFALPSATVRTSATTMDITIAGNPLVVGDFVFVNEYTASAGGDATTINFQSGYVITAGATFTVKFPNANITAGLYANGMVQYLTNRSNISKDCIRFYDGDPTNGNFTTPSLTGHLGWVNFMPPLSQDNFSISGLPAAKYYLAGCRMIVPFKDRLLFIGPVVQTSTGTPIYLQDTVIFSFNGTPYYTASFQGDPRFPISIIPILVPFNQTGFPSAYFEDTTGFGGFIRAGIDEPIVTVSNNEDVLIMGTTTTQIRFIYSGDDIIPFNFYSINSELGSSSTFSVINLDKGVITRGNRGYIISSQTEVVRIDMSIPDQVFQERLIGNGLERMCSQRDFENEWIYFTYLSNSSSGSIYKFPNQSLQYNYRDNTWAVFNETYTTYGSFRRKTGYTWATIGLKFKTWAEWNEPWNSYSNTLLQPEVLGGNQQGFILSRGAGTSEDTSLYIQSFSGSIVTSPDHGLNNLDFIMITGCIGTIASQVNNKIFQVISVTQNTFTLNPNISSGTYLGKGLIVRYYNPLIQTKQFPTAWGMGRKTRIGVQRYLLTTTANSKITLLVYLSQDNNNPYNVGPLVPDPSSVNDSLIYSTLLYTCPESTNIGLTPANVNLQTPTAINQAQLWHRINTSLIGDTIQFGFTMSDDQMREVAENGNPVNATAEIELHGFIIDTYPSQLLV